jgi:hypothetical protein
LQYIKVKLCRYRHAGSNEERLYSYYSFLTSALDGVSCQLYPAAVIYPPRKYPRYQVDVRLGGPRAGMDTEAKGKILYLSQETNPDRPTL